VFHENYSRLEIVDYAGPQTGVFRPSREGKYCHEDEKVVQPRGYIDHGRDTFLVHWFETKNLAQRRHWVHSPRVKPIALSRIFGPQIADIQAPHLTDGKAASLAWTFADSVSPKMKDLPIFVGNVEEGYSTYDPSQLLEIDDDFLRMKLHTERGVDVSSGYKPDPLAVRHKRNYYLQYANKLREALASSLSRPVEQVSHTVAFLASKVDHFEISREDVWLVPKYPTHHNVVFRAQRLVHIEGTDYSRLWVPILDFSAKCTADGAMTY
jgi:hypothetical protein